MVGKPYKCVNCGVEASALYRTYGTVIKLTKCVSFDKIKLLVFDDTARSLISHFNERPYKTFLLLQMSSRSRRPLELFQSEQMIA